MYARDPAKAVEVLDLLLKFFGDGERWGRGRLSDRPGNRCLVGALEFVSSHHAIQSDPAERYLADEISSATACTDAGGDCARFRASLRALSGGRYRVSETVLRRDSLSDFNDGCRDFAELGALILQARASAAMDDANAVPVPRRRLDIELDEFVMA